MANKVALITGASRGIGKQLAIDFALAGYDIAAVARSTADSPTKLPGTVDETAELVREAGQRCITIGADLQEMDLFFVFFWFFFFLDDISRINMNSTL